MIGIILPLGLVIGGGYYLMKKKSGNSSASSTTSPPKFTPGPGGFGRVYGTPSVDIASAFWASSSTMMGCDWVVEGHGFLPTAATILQTRETLDAALSQGESAWPFVEYLLAQGYGPKEAAGAVIASVAAMNGLTAQQCGAVVEGSPVFNWANDVGSRIAAYASKRNGAKPPINPSKPPRQTQTTSTRSVPRPTTFYRGGM